MTEQLSHVLKDQFIAFCKPLFLTIRKKHPRITSVILQYKDGNLYIGAQRDAVFKPIYYDSTAAENDQELVDLVNTHDACVANCFDEIKAKNNRIRGYNILFHSTKTGFKLNICRNTLGSKSYTSSRLYSEIIA